MFNRTQKNDDIDINQDVNELADSLEALLKSYGSEAKDEVNSARSQAEANPCEIKRWRQSCFAGRPRCRLSG